MQIEIYNDYRRLNNILGLQPFAGNFNNDLIPVRYPYGSSERQFNSVNCPNVDINTRVWWDVQ